MRFNRQSSALMVMAALCLFCLYPLAGSSPPPWIRATCSVNGHFLVFVDDELGPINPGGSRTISRTTYRVLGTEPFINARVRINTPAPLFGETADSWQVTKPLGEHATFWPMISDDGASLVLVGVFPPITSWPILRIYRRNRPEGELVRGFTLTDLWTDREINPEGDGLHMFTDATPSWFAGGSLAFSKDGRYFLYRTQWGDALHIGLTDGSVKRTTTSPARAPKQP